MGPRSEDRGERKGAIGALVASRCFNGAAVRRPRRDVEPVTAVFRLPPLQWGRGPKTAESGLEVLQLPPGNALQWGRGPKTAES